MTAPEDQLAQYLKLVQRFREEAAKLGVAVSVQVSFSLPEAEKPRETSRATERELGALGLLTEKERQAIQTLQQKYPLHTEQQIEKLIAEERARGGGLITFEYATEIVDKDLAKQYQKKPVEPKAPVPPIKPVEPPKDLVSELKTLIDKMGLDVTRFQFTDSADKVSVKPAKFLGDDWAQLNTELKALGGVWVRAGNESRWEIPKK